MTASPAVVFNDTSVLINYFQSNHLPVLGELFGDRLRWCPTVERECERKESQLGLSGLADAAREVFRDPLYPIGTEHRLIRDLRDRMAGPGDHPDEHLGEAETITIISARRMNAVFATDDRTAARFAHPIPCLSSWQVLHYAHRRGAITAAESVRFWSEFCARGGTPEFAISTAEKFRAWLTS